MHHSIFANGRKLPLTLLVLAPALALAGCGSKAENDLEAKFARAEAAAVRAENAQKAAEAAAKRAENDKIAAASEEVDLAPKEPQDPNQDDAEADDRENAADNNSPG